jgi:hypothetical protein
MATQFRVQQDLSHLFGINAPELEPLERCDQAMPQILDSNQVHLVTQILGHDPPSSFTEAVLGAS